MNVCRMMYNELNNWLNNKPQHGDVAYLIDDYLDKHFIYIYKGPDNDPYSHLISADWFIEVDKLKIEEPKINKACDNCKHFKNTPGSFSWCSHKEHAGVLVPAFTSCADHEPKQKIKAPFDNLKFFIKDQKTGELEIKYICEDCGKVMEAPFHWQYRMPVVVNGKKSTNRPGYYFYCEECNKKEEKIYE